MKAITRKIDKLGRIVLPMDYRKALGLNVTKEVTLSIEGDAITVRGSGGACKLCGSAVAIGGRLEVCATCIGIIKTL